MKHIEARSAHKITVEEERKGKHLEASEVQAFEKSGAEGMVSEANRGKV